MAADNVPDTIVGLPAWTQTVVTVCFFITAALAGIFGYLKKNPITTVSHRDGEAVAIFPSAKLETAIHEMADRLVTAEERTCSAVERNTDAVNRLTDAVSRLQDVVSHLER